MKTKEYDIDGNLLSIEDSCYSNIPEYCPECYCVQVENYKDFSSKTIQVCEQCKYEMYLAF